MARKIVGCIQSFSKGRSQYVIRALRDSIRLFKGVRALDYRADLRYIGGFQEKVGARS